MSDIICRIIGHKIAYKISTTFEYLGNDEYVDIETKTWVECDRCGKETLE